MTFDDHPPPFYDPLAMFNDNNYHMSKSNFPLNGNYEEQYFSVHTKSDFDLCDSDYSISKSHISSATYTIDSGSTYTLR